MSVASDGTDEGQALRNGDIQDASELKAEQDAAELGSQVSEATAAGAEENSPQQNSTINVAPRTPAQRPASGGAIDEEEFSDFQRPSSADGSLSIPDDLPSVQV